MEEGNGKSLPLQGLRFLASGTFPKIADGKDPQLGPASNLYNRRNKRSLVPGASSSSSLNDSRSHKIYNEYEICNIQFVKGGSCRTGWV